MDKSWDDRLNSPKSGVSFFLAVRTVVGENILEVFLAVRMVVGGNILDVRILEKMTNHFLRNPYKRPEILSDGVIM